MTWGILHQLKGLPLHSGAGTLAQSIDDDCAVLGLRIEESKASCRDMVASIVPQCQCVSQNAFSRMLFIGGAIERPEERLWVVYSPRRPLSSQKEREDHMLPII